MWRVPRASRRCDGAPRRASNGRRIWATRPRCGHRDPERRRRRLEPGARPGRQSGRPAPRANRRRPRRNRFHPPVFRQAGLRTNATRSKGGAAPSRLPDPDPSDKATAGDLRARNAGRRPSERRGRTVPRGAPRSSSRRGRSRADRGRAPLPPSSRRSTTRRARSARANRCCAATRSGRGRAIENGSTSRGRPS